MLTSKFDYLPLSEDILAKWQRIVNLIAKIIDVPTGMITRLDRSQLEVLVVSENEDNPYIKGARYNLDTGRYCETVIDQRKPLLVANALQDSTWQRNPSIEQGMISYLGFPLQRPNGELFGTLCVLDNREHLFSTEQQELLTEFKAVIEQDLQTFAARPGKEEALLLGSEATARALLNTPSILTMMLAGNGTILDVNDTMATRFNKIREELIGLCLWELLPPEVLKVRKAHILTTFNTGKIQRWEDYRAGAWFETCADPIFDEHGTVTKVAVVAYDITERKQAQHALEKSERKYRELVNEAATIILRWDINGNVTFFNEYAQSFFGFSEAEILGKNVVGTIVPETEFTGRDLAQLMEEICLDPSNFEHNENENIKRNGERVWIAWRNRPIFNQAGELIEIHSVGIDITARKRADEALSKARDELEMRVQERTAELEQERRLFVSGPTVVFKWSAAEGWPVEYVSPNVTCQFGYAPEDLTSGKIKFADIVHPDDLAHVAKEVQSYSKSGVPHFEQEYRLANSNGEYRWLYDFTVVVRNDEGVITHFHGYVIDITERKQAEERILASETELRGIMESLQDVYYRTDAQGNIIRVSPSARKVFGFEPDDAVGQPASFFWRHPEQRENLLQAMQAGGGMVQNYEVQVVHKNGTDFWVSVNSHFYKNAQGDIAGVEGAIRDITKRKQAEQELKHQKTLFEAVFRDVPDAMVIANVNREIIMCNPAMTRTFGYEPWELIGHQTALIYENHEEFERQGQERFKLSAEEKLKPYTVNYKRKNGEIFPGETVGTAIRDEAGDIIGFIGVMRDITERKLAEDELQRGRQHFQYLDKISRGLTAAPDLNAMLWNVLEEMLEIFNVDRAWLFYPCDPEAPFWTVPVEVTRPGYDGAFAAGGEIPHNPDTIAVIQDALKSTNPVTHDFYKWVPEPELEHYFYIRTQLIIALHPKIDKPWLLGIHQCSHNRKWSVDDKRLFRDIAERITGALTNRLLQQQLELDIAQRKRIENIEKGRSKVLELLAMGAPIEEILNRLVINAEETNPQMLCSVLLVDDKRTHLKHGAAPSLPDFYNKAIDGMEIGPNVGSCGTAAYTGNRVIIEDVATHPFWENFRELAARAGIR
ncbi:MAG: hypothetical protein AMJ53_06105, partial [Gammaproteobacteria bacterium SG8_11]